MLNRFRRLSSGWVLTLGLALAVALILIPFRADDRVRLGPDALAQSRGSNPTNGQYGVPCAQLARLNSACSSYPQQCGYCTVLNVTFLGPAAPGNSGYNPGQNCGNAGTATLASAPTTISTNSIARGRQASGRALHPTLSVRSERGTCVSKNTTACGSARAAESGGGATMGIATAGRSATGRTVCRLELRGIIMFHIVLTMSLVGCLAQDDDPTKAETQLLLDMIESLQQPLDDFRCEFEGTVRYNRTASRLFRVRIGEDGLYESYNGVFVWRRGGDIYTDVLRRRAPDNTIVRETLAVRMKDGKAEQYIRPNDATIGGGYIGEPGPNFAGTRAFPLYFFSIAYLRYDVLRARTHYWFDDGQIDGQPLRIVSAGFNNNPESLFDRYWIDLRRNGNVRRSEEYDNRSGKAVRTAQKNIKLAAFKAGGSEVWMPVSGEEERYSIFEKGEVITREDDPWWLEQIHVVDGTMEFNRHPGLEVFTIKYKPGTPISDNLRKLQYEYGQQTIRAKPTKREAEKMLNEQVAKAEEQKSELVVASTSEGFPWSTWLAWRFGALVLVSSVVLWIQRRGH